MAKETGLGWTTLSVDDSGGSPVVIKNDITDLSISTPRGVQDTTGMYDGVLPTVVAAYRPPHRLDPRCVREDRAQVPRLSKSK